MAELDIDERDIPQKERDKLPAADFAGKHRSFPIAKPEDVAAAAASIGRAGPDNYSPDELRSRIIAIAKRKGAAYVARLPDSWLQKEGARSLPIVGESVELCEGPAPDGTWLVKVIEEGWGSSGYYDRHMLAEHAPKAFPAGTHAYWNHPTRSELRERKGLRDLDDLRGVYVEAARWDDAGPKGPAVYTRLRVFEQYRDAIREMAPHIGLSIHASGAYVEGEAEGRKGRIITRLDEDLDGLHSIDFVPRAGAGGEVLTMLESAFGGSQQDEPQEEAHAMAEQIKELTEALDKVAALESRAATLEADLTAKDGLIAEQEAKIAEHEAGIAELLADAAISKADTIIGEAVGAAKLPDLTAKRLKESLAADLPIVEGALDEKALSERVATAIEAAVAEVKAIAGTGVSGMGATAPAGDADRTALREAFKRRFLGQGMTAEEADRRAELAVD